MTYREIHLDLKRLLSKKMRVYPSPLSYTANFSDDYGLSIWELNLLLYNVEDHFGIRLENGLEEKLHTMNQLVNVIHRERQKMLEMQMAGRLN